MKVTVEISNENEMEKLFAFFKTIHLDNIEVVTEHNAEQPSIQKGDKKINPKELFGIWQNKPRDIDELRTGAWKRKI